MPYYTPQCCRVWRWSFLNSASSLSANKMSVLTSTPTQPIADIDLQETQAVVNKARQLPLHVAALKDAFPEATQDIARIAENANPGDPDLLKIEVGAIKVRASGSGCSRYRFQSVLLARVRRVQMPIEVLWENKEPIYR